MWPPSSAVRQRAMARSARRCTALKRAGVRIAAPWRRTMCASVGLASPPAASAARGCVCTPAPYTGVVSGCSSSSSGEVVAARCLCARWK